MRTEHAGNEKLRARKLLAQHPHERDRATLAVVGGGGAEISARRFVDRSLEPRRKRGRVPTPSRLLEIELDLGAVRWILFEELLHELTGLGRIERRRKTNGELHRRERAKHVAGRVER